MPCCRCALLTITAWAALGASPPPLALHPANPHYFLFRGRPAVLVTSGEHYGAVINLDFDYKLYLKTLAADGLNLTRLFSGNYREQPGAFHIAGNTLAPAPGRFLTPWPETNGRFDLTRWNEVYFVRLREFLAEASRLGIVVELNLFCPFYEDSMWDVSPLNTKNNVNGIGAVPRTDAFTLKDERLVQVEDALVRKLVTELREFDNLYYEIANEPYFGGITPDWQRHIARTIASAEAALPQPHLISRNIANGSKSVDSPDPLVSIFNFHYARPPEALAVNYGLNKVIGCNETGFDGPADVTYRIQGWAFLMAGGALYNNLDYSFTVGHEDGTAEVPATNPGGGSPALRKQLGILRRFFDRLDFIAMKPETAAASGASIHVLASAGKQYAVYLHRGRLVKDGKPAYQVDSAAEPSHFSLALPAGRYRVEWMNPQTGATGFREDVQHDGGERRFQSPPFSEDLAARITLVR